ncbi:hypothetical protein [Amycolatopsis nigrescens]|uniref:hypothetical protein n=1 Tax=Amycolatopsis nigrescens TaxID=381445 RepID=UPI0003613CC5|nr:hypothetical protein [Amycolatopsis nigrescens]
MDDRDTDKGTQQLPQLRDPDWQQHVVQEPWTGMPRARPRGRRRLIWSAVGLAVLLAAGFGVYQWSRPDSANSASGPPTSAPSLMPEIAKVDLTQPFANTPAALWADGLAGLSSPEPAAVGDFSAAQVADALKKVQQVVATGQLDRKMLLAHDPADYLALFSANERARVKEVLDKPDKAESASYVALVADGFELLPTGPKVNGKLTTRKGDQEGELVVHVSYVIAYAFDPKGAFLTSPSEIVSFIRAEEDYVLRSDIYDEGDVGLAGYGGDRSVYSIACGAANKGFLAPSYSEPRLGGPEFKNEGAVYDLNQPVPSEDSCQ